MPMLPKFLMADNTDQPDAIYIIHTEYPRFVLNLENDDVEWFDALENDDEADLDAEMAQLIGQAEEFYQREVDRYEAE
jgi:hypothetical protein